jgi:threonine dehydratase
VIERPTLNEFRDAAKGLEPIIVNTPLIPYRGGDIDQQILLKPEILQAVNSFKIRGVFNAVASLSADEKAKGVSTVSAGNTAQALAWSARYFGISARSIMPETAPLPKIEAVKDLVEFRCCCPPRRSFAFYKNIYGRMNPILLFTHGRTGRSLSVTVVSDSKL